MFRIDPASPVPLNEQIKAALKGLVARGLLKPGDAVPSIRSLAESLKVNPNTVARAMRELGAEGLIETRRGNGAYVAAAASRAAKDGVADARQDLKEALRLARRGGLGWDDVDALLREARKEEP
jgi:GntR family transcriptional regulator